MQPEGSEVVLPHLFRFEGPHSIVGNVDQLPGFQEGCESLPVVGVSGGIVDQKIPEFVSRVDFRRFQGFENSFFCFLRESREGLRKLVESLLFGGTPHNMGFKIKGQIHEPFPGLPGGTFEDFQDLFVEQQCSPGLAASLDHPGVGENGHSAVDSHLDALLFEPSYDPSCLPLR